MRCDQAVAGCQQWVVVGDWFDRGNVNSGTCQLIAVEGLGECDFVDQWAIPDEIASRADVVTLHCSLNENSKEMINREFLSQMRPSAFLLNTSRDLLTNSAEADDTQSRSL